MHSKCIISDHSEAYHLGTANGNYRKNTMISDFETTCLHQKFELRDGQRWFGCASSLCVEV